MKPKSKGGATRGSRFAAGIPATVWIRGSEFPCTAHNLSRTGVLLVGGFPGRPDGTLEVEISSPHGDLSVRLRGGVVRVEGSDGEVRIALEFLDVDDAHRDTIEVLLSRVIEGHSPGPLESLRPGSPPHEVRKALEQIPLAHRISLASRATPREREFLRQDPHPQVLEALARNPNLLQTEARALAAVSHLLPTTLEVLANDPRWSQDDELKILIASHPRVILPLAERISRSLKPPALRKLAQRPGVNPALRGKLLKQLTRGTRR